MALSPAYTGGLNFLSAVTTPAPSAPSLLCSFICILATGFLPTYAAGAAQRAIPMKQSEFDKFALEYESLHATNIRASGETPAFFAEYKVRDVAALLHRKRLPSADILDFGAGIGGSVEYFNKHLPQARLTCLDVSEKSLELGRSRVGVRASFVGFDGKTIPFPDASFDLCFAACVFHHIPHSEHVDLLREFRRVLRPGGLVFVVEHNPWNLLTTRAVRDCPFDENAVLMTSTTLRARLRAAGFAGVRSAYRIFFPHALRALRPLEPMLTWCPLGAQYYAAGRA
jgi:ubiquinone/menaquinone biosynthesis C-methylase UbiE